MPPSYFRPTLAHSGGRFLRALPAILAPMKPMFLPEVENHRCESGPYAPTIEQMKASGIRVPQILYLFAYKPAVTEHLARFSQAVMRGPSPLSAGMRELIAAFTSKQNQCPF